MYSPGAAHAGSSFSRDFVIDSEVSTLKVIYVSACSNYQSFSEAESTQESARTWFVVADSSLWIVTVKVLGD